MIRRLALVAALAPVLSGCSGEPLGQVKGTVTLDGKPLSKATLTFEAAGKRPATVRVESGKIVEATTLKTGDGVPVGSHKVAVSATEDAVSAVDANPGAGKAPGAGYMTGKSLIPARYNNPDTSGLTVEVKSGENVLDLQLDSK